ncbi:MAG TPA: HAD family hydrolase [Tepidisphaeraceae bacterium]|nr:HAD family hydrolase [Tepidisphaeraceae bacterium]
MQRRPAVFLDRDGVLNRTDVRNGIPHPPASAADLELLPGVLQGLLRLREIGLPLIVVTNQPDVARGTQTREAVEQINARLREQLPVIAIYTCYHDTADNCQCRKPLPGLLMNAAAAYNIDLSGSFMVGDRWSDVAAGQAAGCRTILIDLPYSQSDRCTPDYRVRDLPQAVDIILALLRPTGKDK